MLKITDKEKILKATKGNNALHTEEKEYGNTEDVSSETGAGLWNDSFIIPKGGGGIYQPIIPYSVIIPFKNESKQRNKKLEWQQKTNSKMVDINSPMLIITSTLNRLNTLIKDRDCQNE